MEAKNAVWPLALKDEFAKIMKNAVIKCKLTNYQFLFGQGALCPRSQRNL